MKYAYLSALAFLIASYPVYSFLNPSLETLIERQNALIDRANNEKLESYRAELLDCIDSATGKVLQEFDDCSRTPKPTLQERVGVKKDLLNATGGIAPVPLWHVITVESKQKEKGEPVKSVTNNSWMNVWGSDSISTQYLKKPKGDECNDWKNNPTQVVLHYTATHDDLSALQIEQSHARRFGTEYFAAYHYVIEKDGKIVRTRPESCGSIALIDETLNKSSINIAYVWDDKPNEKQLDSVVRITRDVMARNNIARDSVTAHADIQAKNHKESMEWMFGSKAEFVKQLRISDKITIYGKQSAELTYMWQAWWDKDFIGTIFQESRMSNTTRGDGGQSIGYCQIHKGYQPGWYADYNKLQTMEARLNYCHELYTYSESLPGGVWSRFHGYNARSEHIKNLSIQ